MIYIRKSCVAWLPLLITASTQSCYAAFSNDALYLRCQCQSARKLPVLNAMGPVARAKKMADPAEYNRVVESKMKKEGLTRKQAEEEYNQFLENPPFYYALDKKEQYYKSLGYKGMFEGMIGEADKEGKGEEVRERLTKFRQESIVKALSVLITFVTIFYFARVEYWKDPEAFLPGI